MHSLKEKKKTSLAIHTKLSMFKMHTVQSVLSGEGEAHSNLKQTAFFYTMQRITP
ncbi:unnamed protein product [Staurois parvus]|uniref:Uncharacterized protein n=1 Tax=Staurois parvus TaxID=386267 RepID=A0ABN9E473_9NEOB|nr:unnamed protein product [Staurois parvus]